MGRYILSHREKSFWWQNKKKQDNKIFLFHQFSKMVLVFLISGIYFLCLFHLCEIDNLTARGREIRIVFFSERRRPSTRNVTSAMYSHFHHPPRIISGWLVDNLPLCVLLAGIMKVLWSHQKEQFSSSLIGVFFHLFRSSLNFTLR